MTRTPVMRNLGSMELLFIKVQFTIHHRSLCSLIIGTQISLNKTMMLIATEKKTSPFSSNIKLQVGALDSSKLHRFLS